ncbi:C-terminal binding protein [Peptoniphilus sp. KCTC 25270]|uniref:C-terminal binding protein n=1 Tax=Peptoniphilus sp. KCTC 25270 TaxID=2897414 RepID=UPI001E3E76BF|nr:C-terminal binding protein [Peptoniphilus sp. KCTC 25270]MCD1146637.1 C-terminal binding protein [Peptoniphilus sp. KCTC 25270]
MKKIVLSSVIVENPDIEEKIIEKYEDIDLVFIPNEEEEKFQSEIIEADGIVVADKKINGDRIEGLKNCKVIVRQGIGFDSIDIEAAKKKGIVVSNIPDYSIEEVSEFTVALLLAVMRHVVDYNNHTRAGLWDIQSVHEKSGFPPMRRSSTQTLGIVGMGRIAKLVAKKAKNFGFNMISYDPYVKQESVDDLGVKMVEFDTLIKESDFITLNLPLNKDTYHCIDRGVFEKMKPTSYLINTGRGPLVDEEALLWALENKKIAGAAIDVTETEPLEKEHPLFQCENLIVTPHAAFFTEDSFIELRERALKEAIRVINGEEPLTQVNK